MKHYTSLLIALCFLIGCTSERSSENPREWSDEQAAEWFDQRAWLGQSKLQPDPSINKKEFAVQYHQHKERWDKAFAFLKGEDLSAIEVGNHEIDGKTVFVIVSEYNTKKPEDIPYESHKNYTDIQYVVSGTEYIGLADLSETSVKIPYDEKRDITFHHADEGQNLLAHPGTFFIFSPQNVHRPGVKVEDNIPVKKVVIKVSNQ